MIPALANHLLQSTIFAAAAGMLTRLLRDNRARTRYWIWLTASMKFLVPFSLFIEIGRTLSWSTAPAIAQPRLAFVMDEIARPFATLDSHAATPATAASAPSIVPALLLAAWICGCAAVLIFWFVRWRRVAATVRAGVCLGRLGAGQAVELVASETQMEPGVFGIRRPVLLLPARLVGHLDGARMDAVLTHELCHIRCRDNLTAALHMLVEAVFWFHPIVWWIGARLVEERERACDEEVVRLGNDPGVYAEGILNVCRICLESPLACVSGVSGADLGKRIEAIMTNRIIRGLNFATKLALATAGLAALMVPVVLGILSGPALRAQAQSATASTPKFEVASIKAGCPGGGGPAPYAAGPKGLPSSAPPPPKALKAGGGGGTATSPGRFNECRPLSELIHMAYVMNAGGQFHGVWGPQFEAGPPLEDGPAWVRSDPYQIIAKPAGTASRETMSGPMLQALLEDRFQLKIHRDTREVPIYALTVAKGGTKLTEYRVTCVRFQPRQPGDPMPALAPGQKNCRDLIGMPKGPNMSLEAQAATLDDITILIGRLVDRPVVNKTAIAGKFDVRLEFAIEGTTMKMPPADPAGIPAQPSTDPAGPSIFTAIERLGLKLEPAKGPGDFLVIDHVERPSAN
jgi:uncharacterized protein (TIGR03435 family)